MRRPAWVILAIIAVPLAGAAAPAQAAPPPCTITGTPGDDTLSGTGGNDVICGLGGDDTINGLAGDDYLAGGDGDDALRAGPGSDSLDGGPGNDSLIGFAGDDQLTGGKGADVLSGLGGIDTALYAERTGGVTIDIDDVADDGNATDGPAGARDNVKTDVENLTTGSGHDALIGSAANNVFNGGTGGDTFAGLGGVDTVTYADRTTRMPLRVTIDNIADDGTPVDGNRTDNVLTDVENLIGRDVPAYGRDTLIGSASNNMLVGGRGADTLLGHEGDDKIVANDGFTDAINCGGGANDVAHIDSADPPAPIGCETVIVEP